MEYKEFKNFNAIAFEVEGINYIYDSYSNQLLKVAPVVVDIIDDTLCNLERKNNWELQG